MKPISLKIKGLNSFIEEQTIDFKTLTSKGLFGIFGATGSGKSTILDAITIVLYGEIVRKNKDFININCDTLFISYEFEIGTGTHRKCYIAERNLRRDKHGSIKTKYARLMEKGSDEELKIMAEKPTDVKVNIEQIIGLSLDDFTRSVVLPQGKFSEFLKLKGKDRRDMLERIFALEKYGRNLGEKIKRARNSELKKQSELKGELKRFENISEESYTEKQQELHELNKYKEDVKIKKENAEKGYEKYKDIWKYQNELKDYNLYLKQLKNMEEDINNKKEKSKRGISALTIKPYIDEIINIENEMKNNDRELIASQKILKDIEEEIINIEEKFKKAQEKKDHEIPKLITKESELSTAINIEREIKKLEEERNKLLNSYNDLNTKKEAFENKLKKNINIAALISKKLDENEERVKGIKVDIGYREKIEKAEKVESDYNEQKKKKQDMNNKLNKKNISFAENKKEHMKIVALQLEKKKELELLIKEQKIVANNDPGDNEILLKKQADLNKTLKEVEETRNNSKERELTKKRYDDIIKKKIDIETKMKEAKKEIEEKERRKKLLESEINKIEIENKASILAANLKEGDLCPVCGSVHHEKVAVFVDDSILEEKKELEKMVELEIIKIDHNLRKLENEFSNDTNEGNRVKDKMQALDKELEGKELEQLNKTFEKNKEEFEVLKNKMANWKSDKEKVDIQLNKLKDDKNEIDKQEVKLEGMVNNEKEAIGELKKELSIINQEFENVSTTYLSLKKEFEIENFHEEMQRIKSVEKEMDKLQGQQKELRKEIDEKIKEKEEVNTNIAGLSADIKSIVDVGQEKREHMDAKKEEIKKVTEGKDASEYINDIRKEIKEINEVVRILNEKLEDKRKTKLETSKGVISKKQNKENLTKILNEQNKKVEKLLAEYSFANKEQVLKECMTKEEIENINKEIDGFDHKLRSTLENIERIKKLLNDETINEEQWNKIKEDKAKYEIVLKEKSEEIAVLKDTLKRIEKELEELKEINKRNKAVEHKLSILNDMDKLIQGNKFVEFAAMNQLKYIAREASKRLLSITGNRYALEIDDEGNFTIRDDRNGGVVRETASLSGGETFLASLALALSLSSQIQLRGSAQLEFFFLDEGFGTLDATLLEVVITSLEKLHTDQLSVGIISHVEELKNRVPVKLIVTQAEHGVAGSKVKLEYS
ncbi:exonuclease [Lutibacter sp. B2]|nr:exonuclease [Lutibacter sp. B2]